MVQPGLIQEVDTQGGAPSGAAASASREPAMQLGDRAVTMEEALLVLNVAQVLLLAVLVHLEVSR